MNKEFNKIFTELRKSCNLTQSDCSKIFNVTKSTISGWETGRNEPNIATLKNIADYFNVSIDYLIDRESEDGTIIITNAKQNLSNKNMVYILDNLCNEYNYKLSEEMANALITILKNIK